MTVATTIAEPSGVSVLAHLTSMMNQHAESELRLLHEMDQRYQQRFIAAQEALGVALTAQQRAMEAALVSSDNEHRAALASAKEAVTKAENSINIRLEAMNEFRKAYQDLISTMMNRAETEGRLTALAEKISESAASKDREHAVMRDTMNDLSSRLTKIEAIALGKQQSWGVLIGAIAATGILVGLLSRFIG